MYKPYQSLKQPKPKHENSNNWKTQTCLEMRTTKSLRSRKLKLSLYTKFQNQQTQTFNTVIFLNTKTGEGPSFSRETIIY